MITGQLLVRESSMAVDGRQLLMVIGIIAAEAGADIGLKGEH